MARQNYFEIIKQQGFDSQNEFENIQNLLYKTTNRGSSIINLIETQFLNYKNRNSFINFEQLEGVIDSASTNYDDYLFSYTEMLLDILKDIVEPHIKSLPSSNIRDFFKQQYNAIQYQIENFLAKSNHELSVNEEGILIIVEKNTLATQASQIVNEESLQNALKILEYNHFSNNGNIERKKQILLSLANLLEPERKKLNVKLSELFKKNQNGNIINDLFEMFNKLQLRHNDKNQYISTENFEELETWYDNIYNTVLLVIVSEEQARIQDDFAHLKSARN